jgi:hypothetical protein
LQLPPPVQLPLGGVQTLHRPPPTPQALSWLPGAHVLGVAVPSQHPCLQLLWPVPQVVEQSPVVRSQAWLLEHDWQSSPSMPQALAEFPATQKLLPAQQPLLHGDWLAPPQLVWQVAGLPAVQVRSGPQSASVAQLQAPPPPKGRQRWLLPAPQSTQLPPLLPQMASTVPVAQVPLLQQPPLHAE